MSYQADDIQAHFYDMDRRPPEPPQHTCVVCGDQFYDGVAMGDEKFCQPCYDLNLYVNFYEKCGAESWQIGDLMEGRVILK